MGYPIDIDIDHLLSIWDDMKDFYATVNIYIEEAHRDDVTPRQRRAVASCLGKCLNRRKQYINS